MTDQLSPKISSCSRVCISNNFPGDCDVAHILGGPLLWDPPTLTVGLWISNMVMT